MNPLVFSLVSQFEQLPTKKLPRSANTLSDDPEERIALYERQEEEIFNTHITNGTLPTWVPKVERVVGVQCNRYVAKDGLYYFVCRSSIKSIKPRSESGVKLLGHLMEDALSTDLKCGMVIGLIMWIHQVIISVPLDESFYKVIKDGSNTTLKDFNLLYDYRDKIGITIDSDAIPGYISRKIPIQIGFDPLNRQKSINNALNATNKGVRLYVHARMNYNPCDMMQPTTIRDDIEDARKIGALAVVMHVGKNVAKLHRMRAINQMYLNVQKLLPSASEKCPLLIETPAGAGEELLTTLEEFVAFYNMFTPKEQKVLGVCVDTCHVWSCGYHPLTYLKNIYRLIPHALKLVHFNDSQNPCACNIDRHFSPGGGFKIIEEVVKTCKLPPMDYVGSLGYIGVKRLSLIAKWCSDNNIDAVVE